ncbi:MAG: hypothetical protein QXY49_01870 [Thermofilaceae archaeon]
MERAWELLLLFFVVVAASAPAQPNYEVGPLTFNISNRGVLGLSKEGISVGTGSLMNWGPGWSWVSACSSQSEWRLVSGPTGSETEVELECYARCEYAEIRPKVKYWLGLAESLLEINFTVVSDSSFSGLSWTLQLPINRFSGKNVYIALMNGSLIPVRLREESVPGEFQLTWMNEAIGYVVPVDEENGLIFSVISDAWPQGMPVSIDDEREWGGSVYSLRNWIAQQFTLSAGQTVRFIVYLLPYSNTPSSGVEKLALIYGELSAGAPLNELKSKIISELSLQEVGEKRAGSALLYTLLAFVAVTVIAATIFVYLTAKKRANR